MTTTATDHHFTASEPHPLTHQRVARHNLAICLDVAKANTDEVLAYNVDRMDCYHLRSISLFYTDFERGECNNAGCVATYLSYSGGKPTIHQYGWDVLCCWSGKDDLLAEALRYRHGLKRYSLFTRQGQVWVFNHAGQLPIFLNKEVGSDYQS